jgi:dihydrofolate synthase/folylpolyglutamate synthase
MPDHAVSDHPAVQAQLDRLATLSPGADILGLERITTLLARLGNPERALPPVLHVAGTNGKGSTCAFLRAALEADGRSVHVYTSPHLCRFNERIRVNGALIEDEALADQLGRVLDAGEGIGASFFEVTTAAAFLSFAEHPADACIIEVGLGGRLDATNVIEAPVACGIAQLGLDHQQFLGRRLTDIAGEKAGIAKSGAPVATLRYEAQVAAVVEAGIGTRGGRWLAKGAAWDIAPYRGRVHYRDVRGRIELPAPRLAGAHQVDNLGLAIAMLRHQQAVPVSEAALKAAPLWAQWPARLQRLEPGPLIAPLGEARAVWLDGGHNPSAGKALARHFVDHMPPPHKLEVIVGMLANKDARGFLDPLRKLIGRLHSVPVPGHAHHAPQLYAALAEQWGLPHAAHADPAAAIAAIARQGGEAPVLLTGSLYLAGEVLKANDQLPG